MPRSMTRTELLALPASVPLWPTAGEAFGLGRSATYDLAARGEFPVRILRLGRTYRVAAADLLAALNISVGEEQAPTKTPNSGGVPAA